MAYECVVWVTVYLLATIIFLVGCVGVELVPRKTATAPIVLLLLDNLEFGAEGFPGHILEVGAEEFPDHSW